MILADLLRDISEAGLKLATTEGEDALRVSPAQKLTPDLASAIREHKDTLVRVTLEDQRLRETNVIQSERQVFDLAYAHLAERRKGLAT